MSKNIDEAQKRIFEAGKDWEDFLEYVDGIDDWDMSDVERYINR